MKIRQLDHLRELQRARYAVSRQDALNDFLAQFGGVFKDFSIRVVIANVQESQSSKAWRSDTRDRLVDVARPNSSEQRSLPQSMPSLNRQSTHCVRLIFERVPNRAAFGCMVRSKVAVNVCK